MHELLAALLPAAAICGSSGAIAGGLFAAALAGSVAHCLPMCGPFVLMQSAARGGEPLLRRLAGALLLRYQAGRLLTYVALGAAAGGAGGWISREGAVRWPLALLLGLAALAFLAQAASRLMVLPAAPLAWLSRPLADLVVPLAARRPGGFTLGLLLGLLPCGFLYAAVAAAAATGSAAGGALAMASFGAGTVPALVAVALAGRAALGRWRRVAGPISTGLFLLNAATLSAAALRVASG
jgi:sulfite exporter TauE/SafE